MRTRTRWVVAGGAAAFVLTPIAAIHGSTALDTDLQRSGVVVDAAPTVKPGRQASTKPEATASPEPTGTKTVSAASPVSPRTSVSSASPKTPS